MKRIDAYLFFENNCREAMTYYQQVLGGELNLTIVGESPVAEQLPPEMKDNVLHGKLINDNVVLMASDNCMGAPLDKGRNFSLSLSCSNEEEVHSLYAKLADSGEAVSPPKTEFWGDVFGMLVDKFGISWMLNYRPEKQ
ncbi:VOC family protein [Mucilaginibacter galii]|uniref:VOC family protein n=1 Tax=Mucilaginibacter galii TaxID=2005073 RepID=A0A917N383_9SPHI|nr:VOC family protein [Mucilaginibacter galii]GGI50842.1 VOC family protein [Mucilaginibacter galii]